MHAMPAPPSAARDPEYPRSPALLIVDTVRRCGIESADWCVSATGDAVCGHIVLADADAVLHLVQRLARLATPIELDVVPLTADGRGRWSVKLRAGHDAAVLGDDDDDDD
jgi:hypothetical protein